MAFKQEMLQFDIFIMAFKTDHSFLILYWSRNIFCDQMNRFEGGPLQFLCQNLHEIYRDIIFCMQTTIENYSAL